MADSNSAAVDMHGASAASRTPAASAMGSRDLLKARAPLLSDAAALSVTFICPAIFLSGAVIMSTRDMDAMTLKISMRTE
ncbi:hypothetical protein AWY79_06885 [Pseudodesulfovibrio indicus]|uniref:Uncharacterized protein n=1 Tax=Pseudodesulfovibrio indicus TaxID=1716143 RepID=A0ABN4LXT5_9BACT|nr:hypothetical protein AWY79_06885 [Pseudodesulfovibrio indicus]